MAITIAGLSGKQVDIFKTIVDSTDRIFCLNASRQSGKSQIITRLITFFALKEKCDILVAAPQYKHVDVIFNRLKKMSNLQYFVKSVRSSSPQSIEFINGSTVSFRTLDNPLSVRGGTYKYVFCDEFAFVDNGILTEHIMPTTNTFPDKKVILCSTPFGKNNDFYEYFTKGVNSEHRVRSFELRYTDNPKYDLEEVKIAKESYPDLKFRQEYEAEFLDGESSVFKNIKDICILSSYPEFSTFDKYFAGVDWGRTNDSTVLTVMNNFGQVVETYSNKSTSWDVMINDIITVLKRFGNPYVLAENNGLGNMPVETLSKLYPNTLSFNTNTQSKTQIIEKLIMGFTNRDIQLPTKELNKKLYSELESFEIYLNPITRSFQYAARKGLHDDTVISLALANWCRTYYGSRGVYSLSTYNDPNKW